MIGPSALIPATFDVPDEERGELFHIQALTWERFPGHYHAYRLNADRIVAGFAPQHHSPWPRDRTAEFASLLAAWTQMEATTWRSSFTYVALDTASGRNIGACYIARSAKLPFEVDCRCWAATDDREASLHEWFRHWVHERWPFDPEVVAWPGRELTWAEWEQLDDAPVGE